MVIRFESTHRDKKKKNSNESFFFNSERGIRTLDTTGMNRVL